MDNELTTEQMQDLWNEEANAREAEESFQCADLATQRCGFLNGQTQRIILYPCLGHFLFGPLADPVPDGI